MVPGGRGCEKSVSTGRVEIQMIDGALHAVATDDGCEALDREADARLV